LAMPDENSGFELSDKLEVIGNIHDNPELLKGGAFLVTNPLISRYEVARAWNTRTPKERGGEK